ncbi:MAG: hypothetical protein V1772_02250 [Chloroflexota bacterium]
MTLAVLAAIPLTPIGVGAVDNRAAIGQNLVPAVVYIDASGSISELALKGTWKGNNLSVAAGAPHASVAATRAMGLRRGDGVSMVVYRGTDDHVQPCTWSSPT